MGFKYALIANPNQYYTFQFRTYVPTGDSYQGLGTGHASLEPALLVFQRLTDRLYFSGEVPRLDPGRRLRFRRECPPVWSRLDVQHRPDRPLPHRPGQ